MSVIEEVERRIREALRAMAERVAAQQREDDEFWAEWDRRHNQTKKAP